MLPFPSSAVYQASKCYFTYGTMGHVDRSQLPSSKKPWSTIESLGFIHRIDLILPQECADITKQQLAAEPRARKFQRVIMTPGQILEADFFQEYVKMGNILMLSEGRPGHDNVFTLRDGKLVMFLDRETYERAGLVGKPHGVKGKRGLKPRWVVEVDLKAESMKSGKKGFDRLVYACKNALSTPRTWLFCNMAKTPDPDPLSAHFPTAFTALPGITESISVKQPELGPSASLLSGDDRLTSEEFATDLYEWLSLIRLSSPRVEADDQIDPYLSCYQIPGDSEHHGVASLCKLTWEGFFPSLWAREMLADTILSLPLKTWFAMGMSAFASSKGLAGDGAECTIMRPPNAPGEFLLWEVKTHE